MLMTVSKTGAVVCKLIQAPDPTTKRPDCGAFSIQRPSGSVKQLLEKRFLPLGMAVLMTLTIWLGVTGIVALIILRLQKRGLLHRSSGRRILGASFNDFVEFPAVEPNTPALGAIVNLDTLALTHHERDTTDGTRHTGGASHQRGSWGLA
jgi:hypothetical protein